MAQLPDQTQFGDYGEWPGRDVLDSGGERLGGVREIYLDRETGRPEWVLVQVDGGESRFVPLADAAVEARAIRVAHPSTLVRSAPSIGAEPRIDQDQERELYAHYRIGYSESESGSGLPDDQAPPPDTAVHEPAAGTGEPDRADRSEPASVAGETDRADRSEPASVAEERDRADRSEPANVAPAPAEESDQADRSDPANVAPAPAGEPDRADIPEPPLATGLGTPAAFRPAAEEGAPEVEPPSPFFAPPVADTPAPAPATPVFTPPAGDTPTPVLPDTPAEAAATPVFTPPVVERQTPLYEPASDTPPPAAARPAFTPPAGAGTPPPTPVDAPSGGPLQAVRSRPVMGIAAAASLVAVLLLILRRRG